MRAQNLSVSLFRTRERRALSASLLAVVCLWWSLGVVADDSCRWANDDECDVPQYCEAGTDDTDCEAEANRPPPKPDSCEYANDGECDLPPTCNAGTDTTDCAAESSGPNACRYANDGECDVPGLCLEGSDTADCEAAANLAASGGNDSCRYANDGECDEPNLCQANTDITDCAAVANRQANDPENSCRYAYDQECDEPNLCDAGTDTADCVTNVGENSCRWANDGECDEPGVCDAGTDTADCSATGPGGVLGSLGGLLGGALAGPDSCEYANDGECDEPGICDVGTDTTDCGGVVPATLGQSPTGQTLRPQGPRGPRGPRGPNHCAFAQDGVCDEPNRCAPNTDTDDCTGVPVLFNRGTDHTGQPLGWHPVWRGLLAFLVAGLVLSLRQWLIERMPKLSGVLLARKQSHRAAHRGLAQSLTRSGASAFDNAVKQRDTLAQWLREAADHVNLPLEITLSGANAWPVTLIALSAGAVPANAAVALPAKLRIEVVPKDSHQFDCEYTIDLSVGDSTRSERGIVELGMPQIRAFVAALSGAPFARSLAGQRLRKARSSGWQFWRPRNRLAGVRSIGYLQTLATLLLVFATIFALLAWPFAITKPLAWTALGLGLIAAALSVVHATMRHLARPVAWLTAGLPLNDPRCLKLVASGSAVLETGAQHQQAVLDALAAELSAAVAQGLTLERCADDLRLRFAKSEATIRAQGIGSDLHITWAVSDNEGVWVATPSHGGFEAQSGRYVRGIAWSVDTVPQPDSSSATVLESAVRLAIARVTRADHDNTPRDPEPSRWAPQ